MKLKSFLSTALLSAAVSVSFAQDTSVNSSSFEAPELSEVPVIDGDPSDAVWESIEWMEITMPGDGPGSVPSEPGNWDAFMKSAWDDETNAVYFLFRVIDDSYIKDSGQGADSGSSYQSESLEFVINAENTGSAEHGEGSDFHAQYVFEFPSTLKTIEEGGVADLPVSLDLVEMPVYEKVDGHFAPSELPYDLDDAFIESAGKIRATDPDAVNQEWGTEFPVEFYFEIKLVLFSVLKDAIDSPDNVVKDLEPLDVIGVDPAFNDTDVFEVERTWRKNLSGDGNAWNSSENLAGMILQAPSSDIEDWSLLNN